MADFGSEKLTEEQIAGALAAMRWLMRHLRAHVPASVFVLCLYAPLHAPFTNAARCPTTASLADLCANAFAPALRVQGGLKTSKTRIQNPWAYSVNQAAGLKMRRSLHCFFSFSCSIGSSVTPHVPQLRACRRRLLSSTRMATVSHRGRGWCLCFDIFETGQLTGLIAVCQAAVGRPKKCCVTVPRILGPGLRISRAPCMLCLQHRLPRTTRDKLQRKYR